MIKKYFLKKIRPAYLPYFFWAYNAKRNVFWPYDFANIFKKILQKRKNIGHIYMGNIRFLQFIVTESLL